MDILFHRSRQTPAAVVVSPKPDYRMPLRMQAWGRSPLDAHQRHLRHLLWLRAMKDRSLWRRALTTTILIEAIHAMLEPAMFHTLGPPLLLRWAFSSICTLAGTLALSASSQVRRQAALMSYLDN
jgi:hypothetical protein